MTTKLFERINELMKKDGTHPKDVERKSLFMIISGNDELWNLRNKIYDFENHWINSEILESGICTSSKTLIQIGFNLYNGYQTESLLDCFSGLDENNFELVIQALRIRLNQIEVVYEN